MKKIVMRALALSLTVILLLTSLGIAETLRFRDTGDDVVKLQGALQFLGYYKGDLDGKFGTMTLHAVKWFQKNEGLTVDGLVGTNTQARLMELTDVIFGETETPEVPEIPEEPEIEEPKGLFAGDYRTMQFGTAGDRVRILQRALLALGFEVGNVDGDFGSATHKAVKAFQTIVGLTADGKVGKKTFQKLENYFDDDGNCISGPIAGNKPAEPEVDPNAPEYAIPQRTLRFGDKGLDVKYTMQRLYSLGYYNKLADETFGTGMLKAIKAFQKKNSLVADGVIGAKTIALLFSDSALDADDAIPTPDEDTTGRTIKMGDSGEDVKAVQVRLSILGYYTGKLDGKFGAGTLKAIRSFQARNALTVDGKVGPRTLEKLESTDAVPAVYVVIP